MATAQSRPNRSIAPWAAGHRQPKRPNRQKVNEAVSSTPILGHAPHCATRPLLATCRSLVGYQLESIHSIELQQSFGCHRCSSLQAVFLDSRLSRVIRHSCVNSRRAPPHDLAVVRRQSLGSLNLWVIALSISLHVFSCVPALACTSLCARRHADTCMSRASAFYCLSTALGEPKKIKS